MTEHAYLIALLPLLSFVMIVFFLRWKEKVAAGFSITMILTSWVMSVIVLIETLMRHGEAYEWFYRFIDLPRFAPEIGILIDPACAVMLVVVTTVGACVEIYSVGYMHGDPRFSRFFAYLSLFLFSMLGLVLANNFFMIFIFWELVGLTSYLLIGFWFEKKSAADACKKAFLTTRIGDLGFLIGLFMIVFYAGTFNYGEVFAQASAGALPTWVLIASAIFIFCGAVGKSAQFPLHVWLPDAMEGPTPVSALIHAATMVAAGVYLVAKAMPLFATTASASMVVAVIGLVTSLMAATIALVQNDFKRVLAFSTCSQLGYMIMALGLYGYDTAMGHHSPGYYAGTFHLMTHAFFKALLFLGAGSVIHAVHTNNIQLMGGLFNKMKITAWTFVIAALSISGIFPLSGFWSKDEIVATASHHPVFMFFTLLIAAMTAFYMFRLTFLAFFGKPRDQHAYDHAHESPRSMTYPLIFLAFLSIFAGWAGLPWLKHGFAAFVYTGGEPYHPHANWLLMFISTVVAGGGIFLAYAMYFRGWISPQKTGQRFSFLYKVFYNKYYFDELYEFILLKPIMKFADWMWAFDAHVIDGLVNGVAWLTVLWSDIKQWFDKWIVDGAVNGSGAVVRAAGNMLRFVQTGAMQFYTLFILIVIIVFILYKLEIASSAAGWPLLTVVFVLAVSLLGLLTRSAYVRAQEAKQEK
ncbi:MAG: NADH-quinone oxidoreductase subunit L [bacterium]